MSVARFSATLHKEGRLYVAQCVDVDVASQGGTVEEALANLREALLLYFEDEPVPETDDDVFLATLDVPVDSRQRT